MNLEFHPLANIFPFMDAQSFARLLDDIKANGVHEPIWLYGGQVIDGRHRYQAAQQAGIDCPTREYVGADPVAFVLSLNLNRRHLDASQRAMVASNLASLPVGTNQHAQICAPSQSQAADMLNVSRRAVQSGAKLQKYAVLEILNAVRDGTVSINAATKVATLPPAVQSRIADGGASEVKKIAAQIGNVKPDGRNEIIAELREQLQESREECANFAEELEAYRAVEAGTQFDEIRKLQALSLGLKSQLDDYTNQNQQLKKQVRMLRTENDRLLRECKESTKTIKKLEAQGGKQHARNP